MELLVLPDRLSVCKVRQLTKEDLSQAFYFVGRTDEELSLVCVTDHAPAETIAREDGWRGFRIQGVLDFSLIGILAPIAQLLADARIGIFAVSTYNTDYVLVKEYSLQNAVDVLRKAGYTVLNAPC